MALLSCLYTTLIHPFLILIFISSPQTSTKHLVVLSISPILLIIPWCISGDSWIKALYNGTHITSGYNSNFGKIRQINSCCAEIYISLSASLFLYHYANYFIIDIRNKFLSICDNLAFVNKLSWLLEDDYNSHGLHKFTEQGAFHLILQILPKVFAIEHIKSHQYDSVLYKDLSTKARLNIDADKIATLYSSIPLNHHIKSTKTNYIRQQPIRISSSRSSD